MTTDRKTVDIFLAKSRAALSEARHLMEMNFYDGAKSRACVSSILAVKAAIGKGLFPSGTEVLDIVAYWVVKGKVTEDARIYLRAAMIGKYDADESAHLSTREGVETAIKAAEAFFTVASGVVSSSARDKAVVASAAHAYHR